MLKTLTRSLSFRLLAIFAVMALVFVWGTTEAIRWVYTNDDFRELVSGHLALHVDYVRRDIGNPPRIDRAIAITQKVPVDIRIVGPALDWASDPDFPELQDLNFGASKYFGAEPGAWLEELKDVQFAELKQHRFLKIDQGPYAIIVSSPQISDHTVRPALLPIILGIGLLLLALSYVFVRFLFRPIEAIRTGTARIGRGDFDYRIADTRQDELGDLARDVNKLAGDVRGMLDAKRQLLLGISHELRSPLSRLRLSVEFVEDRDARENLRIEIAEMDQIVSTLLEAERLNTRHAALNRTEVHVRELVDQLIDDYFDRDRSRIQVQFEDDDIVVNVDDTRLILLIKNLLSNALRYSDPAAGPVVLEVGKEQHELVVKVRDRGPGFSPEQVDHIGEPFFRADPSRTRTTGGAGLGLYLTKLVVEAHGGSLRLDKSYTEGACLVVRLPA